MALRIDGKAISMQIKDECREKVQAYKEKGIEIQLAVIQVGNDPASSVYVGNKKKACEYIGIGSLAYELPESTTEEELLDQGIKPNTIRLSIGTENIDDIIEDLEEAFKAIQ